MTQGVGRMVFDEGMAAFVLSSKNSFGTPGYKDGLLEGGNACCAKREDRLPSSSSVMDTGGKQLDIGFFSNMAKKRLI